MGNIGTLNSNSILTPDLIAKEALRLLKNHTIAATLVYNAYEKEFTGKKAGDTITIKKPSRMQSEDGATITNKQSMVDLSDTLTIDNQKHIALGALSTTRSLSLADYKSRYLDSAVAQLANDVDKSIIDAMAAGTNSSFYKTAIGTAIDTDTFLTAAAHQTMLGVEPSKRAALLNPLDGALVSKDVKALYTGNQVDKALQYGYVGPLAGYRLYSSQNVGNYNPTGSDDWLVNGAVAEGATTVTIDTGTTAPAAGDVIAFAGVNWVNPMNREDTGIQATFVVKSYAANVITLNVPLYSHTQDYANVYSLPADNAAITVLGTAGTATRQNFLFQKKAVALAVIPLIKPPNKNAATVTDPKSGLSIRVVEDYDITNDELITRLDVVWGVKVIYPELIMRLYSE